MFGRSRWTEHQERRVSARHGSGDALVKRLPPLLGRLSPVRWGTLLQSRSRTTGSLRSRSCSGEDAFVQRKSRFFTGKRTWTRSGGCQPAVAREPGPRGGFHILSHLIAKICHFLHSEPVLI